MNGTMFRRLGGMALICLVSRIGACLAADDDLARINKDILGSWLVDVDGERRLRVFKVTRAEFAGGEWTLENTYGWTDGDQSPIGARLAVKPGGYTLLLTTQANSRIAAELSGVDVFEGSFESAKGKRKQVRLERLTAKELASRAAALSAERMRSQIKAPGPGVSADCALWLGGWEGQWTTLGYTGDVRLWVTEVTQAGDTCNLFIQARQGIGAPPRPLTATDRTAAEYPCNSSTGGNCRMRIAEDGAIIDINYRNIAGGTNYARLRKIASQ